jgi:hypothetical protein
MMKQQAVLAITFVALFLSAVEAQANTSGSHVAGKSVSTGRIGICTTVDVLFPME